MIYLDYQATTPLAPEARDAMLPFLDGKFGNPHSPHRLGREAKVAVEIARAAVLEALLEGSGASPEDGRLLFTSGATEALNWAIKGTYARLRRERPRIVTSAIEHSAVLDTIHALGHDGADVTILPVDGDGVVDPAEAIAAIDGRAALVALMLVNNEVGTIQPVAAIGAATRAAGAVMVCDAVQGFGRIPVPVAACDLVAVSAHKIHGPKGIGALWVRRGCEPEALLDGGGQEGGIRSGTLAPMLCAGFGAAATVARRRMAKDRAHVERLASRLIDALGPGWIVNGSLTARWAGNLNVRRDGLVANRLISELRDIAFSAGSACASGSGRPSHVLAAIGLSDAQARSSIRLGFGRDTIVDEIDTAAAAIRAGAERQMAWA